MIRREHSSGGEGERRRERRREGRRVERGVRPQRGGHLLRAHVPRGSFDRGVEREREVGARVESSPLGRTLSIEKAAVASVEGGDGVQDVDDAARAQRRDRRVRRFFFHPRVRLAVEQGPERGFRSRVRRERHERRGERDVIPRRQSRRREREHLVGVFASLHRAAHSPVVREREGWVVAAGEGLARRPRTPCGWNARVDRDILVGTAILSRFSRC
mmetsp:Transcript_11832/g.49714  ORF Transcript_11832/g.49714 Transcript_11832/m.49714 type:complete len:216 (-) Transcript_11832:144-791(-)